MAVAAARKAQELSESVSEREKRRIALRALQMEAILDISNPTKHAAYKKAIEAALTIDINDPELWLLRGNAEEPTAAGRGQRGLLASAAFYEAALKRSPENFAAYHYLIHTYEELGRMEDALQAGERYASLVPAVPHAQHMYGHDLRVVGRVEESIAQFRKADELERAYYTSERIDPKYDWHHVHNLDLMSISFEYRGEIRQAEALWRDAYTLPPVDAVFEAYRSRWPELLLRNGQYQEALVACKDLVGSRSAVGRSVGHAFRGQVLIAMGKDQEARQELEQAEAERTQVQEYDSEPLMPQPRQLTSQPIEFLKVQLEMYAKETRSAGKEHLRTLLTHLSQTTHSADGLIAVFRLEYLSSFAAKAGDTDLAEFAARLVVKFDANHAGGHYALALAAERASDLETAKSEFAKAAKLWSSADADYEPARVARERANR
jgi:tetratricopeptide (TPR) repeat protein